MMKTMDMENKDISVPVSPSENKLGKQVKSFFFPAEQKAVYAETYEEAVAIINNEKNLK